MNNNESYNNNAILERICDRIFLKTLFNSPYNQKWHKSFLNSYIRTLVYKTKIRGIEINVHVSMNGTKAKARLFVGSYQYDKSSYFSSNINFSITKKNYHNDFINRLGLKDIETHVSNIVKEREEENKIKENLALKIGILKRYLPFQNVYNCSTGLVAYLDDDKTIEIFHINCENATLKMTANIDFLMKLCAFINKDLE